MEATAAHARAPATPLRAAGLLLRWPRHEPLAALVSGGDGGAQNAWTILARPRAATTIDGALEGDDAVRALARALDAVPRPARGARRAGGVPPFDGGLVVALGYGLGACLEPRARDGARVRDGAQPHAVILDCDDAWCLEHATGALHAVGSPPALLPEDEAAASAWSVEDLRADESDAAYAAHVARTVEFIRAGDAFQANVARRFSARFTGCARGFAAEAIARNRAWFGGYIEFPAGGGAKIAAEDAWRNAVRGGPQAGALVSMSPELFLRVGADGSCVTRPIKGTRPAEVCASELARSEKDAAELAMIVDLMRNDLGRVAELGSVRVTEGRTLETHRTVHHGVAEIRAELREGTGWLDLLRATFPPGSVTGAPKVRAMQIIDALEEHPRGFYCGAIGFIARSGHAALNVAIRTAQLSAPDAQGARRATYHAGCGIVADSDPASEVAETHAKTRAFAQLVR
ncbi:MAG: anthranilate synthase component I family protein [Planctomycetota bacterium]